MNDSKEEKYKNSIVKKLIDIKSKSGKHLKQNEIFSEVLLFITAGYETTANTIAWAIFILSNTPEIKSKARDEMNK